MRVVRLTGDLTIDCIQIELGFQESGLAPQTASSSSDLRKREVQAEQLPPILILLENTILIPRASLMPAD